MKGHTHLKQLELNGTHKYIQENGYVIDIL